MVLLAFLSLVRYEYSSGLLLVLLWHWLDWLFDHMNILYVTSVEDREYEVLQSLPDNSSILVWFSLVQM